MPSHGEKFCTPGFFHFWARQTISFYVYCLLAWHYTMFVFVLSCHKCTVVAIRAVFTKTIQRYNNSLSIFDRQNGSCCTNVRDPTPLLNSLACTVFLRCMEWTVAGFRKCVLKGHRYYVCHVYICETLAKCTEQTAALFVKLQNCHKLCYMCLIYTTGANILWDA